MQSIKMICMKICVNHSLILATKNEGSSIQNRVCQDASQRFEVWALLIHRPTWNLRLSTYRPSARRRWLPREFQEFLSRWVLVSKWSRGIKTIKQTSLTLPALSCVPRFLQFVNHSNCCSSRISASSRKLLDRNVSYSIYLFFSSNI